VQAQDENLAGFLDAIAQVVDDMAALLAASVLQLLGGCRGAAAAWEALQASGFRFKLYRSRKCHAAHVASSGPPNPTCLDLQ
jgi:hypothetical protein